MPYLDPQKYKEYQHAYQIKNKQKLQEYKKVYQGKNSDKIKQRSHRWYMEHRVLSSRVKLTEEQKKINRAIAWQVWYSNNKDKKTTDNKAWVGNNKDRRRNSGNKYKNSKYSSDIQFKLSALCRSRLKLAIKSNQRAGSAVRDLGCTISELKMYIEGQFKDGMTWKNWSTTGWHIDHKIPLAFFDLTNREQFLQAVHYTNLQPMWAKENLQKGGRYE